MSCNFQTVPGEELCLCVREKKHKLLEIADPLIQMVGPMLGEQVDNFMNKRILHRIKQMCKISNKEKN